MLAVDLKNRIKKSGPIPFSDFVESCLYDLDDGFYSKRGSVGRRGDFLTSPEVGPFFGSLIANWLDDVWLKLNKPEIVINCIGLLIEDSKSNIKDSVFLNAYLPHYLNRNVYSN